MKYAEHIVNLDLSPSERWSFLKDYTKEMNELFQCYLKDFEEAMFLFESIGLYKDALISKDYLDEIEYISTLVPLSANEVLILNLYYDLLKFYFACSAFAVSDGKKIYHARNLDWHTENDLLSKHTCIFNFQKGGKTVYKSVGWYGFTGVLSGTKPNCFSVTLNAVLSKDDPEIAYPISFLLRDILEQETSYEAAKQKLEQTKIICDCLLLLSGTKPHEKVVIERTPTRFATRTTNSNFIAVTNDYKKLANTSSIGNLLQDTSCERYDRVIELLGQKTPETNEACINILKDEQIKMLITVQQMAFDNLTGAIEVI